MQYYNDEAEKYPYGKFKFLVLSTPTPQLYFHPHQNAILYQNPQSEIKNASAFLPK